MNEDQKLETEVMQDEKWHAPLTRVTPLSRILALALFVALPFIGFYLGMQSGKTPQTVAPPVVMEPGSDDNQNEVPTTPVVQVDDSDATEQSIAESITANNMFALEMYNELRSAGDDNVFFSPYSISTALGMTYEGARGETADEMRDVFHFSDDDIRRRSSAAATYNRLNSSEAEYQLHTANALWVQQDYDLLDTYTDTVSKYYGGNASNVDFVNATEETRTKINTWVEERTNNKIRELFMKGTLNTLTRLVLTNTIYFKGTWAEQFNADRTSKQDFTLPDNTTVSVDMMQETAEDVKFGYAETDSLQILEMPYEGGDLSMLVLLPKDNDIQTLEKSLSYETLKTWSDLIHFKNVQVYMPKFTFKTKYTLNDTLKILGMPTAFNDLADFSAMTGKSDLFINLVVHQAFVEVNEEGTEATAATGVSMMLKSLPMDPPPIFRADHPFIFLIQERGSGNILFMGKVNDPTTE